MKILEKDIQKQCLDYLRLKKIFCYKVNNAGIYKKSTGSYIPSGMLGIPDIIAHCRQAGEDGRVIYIEVKTPTGKLSEHQIAFQNQCRHDMIDYWIVRSLDELIININGYELQTS